MAEMDRRRYASTRPRGPDGRFLPTHGAYTGRRLLRRPDRRRSVVKRAEDLQHAYALACGYPVWSACPAPLQAAIRSAARLELFAEALFRPFWAGQEVPRRFDVIVELLRRMLALIGVEPRQSSPDVAAMLAAMRTEEGRQP